jgi:hypothetical protein
VASGPSVSALLGPLTEEEGRWAGCLGQAVAGAAAGLDWVIHFSAAAVWWRR